MSSLSAFKARLADIDALIKAVTVLDWDQQCFMPRGGAEARAEHVGILSRMAHELAVSDETRHLLEKAGAEAAPGSDDEAMVRVAKRDIELKTKIPAKLVEEKSRLAAQAHELWITARANNAFKEFAPVLEKMIDLAGQEAECLGYQEHIYDALLDQYEEGATTADVRAMFDTLRPRNVELVRQIKERGEPVDDSPLHGKWEEASQRRFTESLVRAIGFDMDRGRQDTAPHPFCTTFSVGDVRLTTRFKDYLPSAVMGSLHEAGHGMYEQGSPMKWDRTPLAGGVSLGIHESQSRTWENIVGRSKAFWSHFLPELHKTFPTTASHNLDAWYRMINKVEPSFIRVEADEVTYNLHILVRFELECDLLTGTLAVKDLPEAWNGKYTDYLGITPKTDSEGCLQDVHWSGGLIGYFPTYSMGNLLSYQIWTKLREDVGDTDALMAKGDFKPILEWLKLKIYSQGRKYPPKELVQRVTGKPMGATDYLDALEAKYREVYSL